MLKSKPITKYFGFTEKEMKDLCDKYDMDFDTTKTWYNGYLIDRIHMYNPNSVSLAMKKQDFDSYWKNTSSFESINTFITMNYEGLKDDALTALIHLGYLGYDAEGKDKKKHTCVIEELI